MAVVGGTEAVGARDLVLALLNDGVFELHNHAAHRADEVVVVALGVHGLEAGLPVLKAAFNRDSGVYEQLHRAVYRRVTDARRNFSAVLEELVDRHMALGREEGLEHHHPLPGVFEPFAVDVGVEQVLGGARIHLCYVASSPGLARARGRGYAARTPRQLMDSTTSGPPLVVGTAGHVDHGKTSLVRALTGVDLDTLPEERARGITISLGFTPLALPSGRVAGLVDVPGHESLVRTMVAGASGMDAVMLCVSAPDGVMPQTREHLAILGLMGVIGGILVVTKADAVDPELLELCIEEIREQVRGTFLDGAPVAVTSAETGQGIAELRQILDQMPIFERDTSAPFRLPVDRAFARRGFGTVVTGTVWSGLLRDGAEVELVPGGRRVRVRGIQVHRTGVSAAEAGARTALNLAGVDVSETPRGSWICAPGAVPTPHVIDARYRHLPDAPMLAGEIRAVVLHGTREVHARVVPLGADELTPGWEGLIQLRCAEPLPCLPGDRYVLRRESPATTLGGGILVDPWAKVVRARGVAAAIPLLSRIEQGDSEAWLERAGPAGLLEAEVRARVECQGGGEIPGERLGERRIAAVHLIALRAALHAALAAFHLAHPLTPGANRKALRTGLLLALPEREYLSLIDEELRTGTVRLEGARVAALDFRVLLRPDHEAWIVGVRARVAPAGLEGIDTIEEVHPDREALLFLMRERGELDQVGGRWVAGSALDELILKVKAWFTVHEVLDPLGFKDLTGLTRRTAIPLLEWLDARGITRRKGDVRIAAPAP